jgi:NAD(P)-dependent dehydrogenase (short-subunit alcohol dehydrogenase family)
MTSDDVLAQVKALPEPSLVVSLPSLTPSESQGVAPSVVLERNLKFPFLVVQHFAQRMLSAGPGGVFINVVEDPDSVEVAAAPFSAAAQALVALTRVLAVEWAPRGIRVNSIVADGALDRDYDGLALAIAFLSDARAAYVTGQVLRVGSAPGR